MGLNSDSRCKNNMKSVSKIYVSGKMLFIYHCKNALNTVESCITKFEIVIQF